MSKELIEIIILVNNFFDNYEQTYLWMKTDNPLLGGVSPMDMVENGKSKRLLEFVKKGKV